MSRKMETVQSDALKSEAILFGLISEFRGTVPIEDATEIIMSSAYLFWQDPDQAIDALESGEKRLQSYLFEACQTLCKERRLPLKAEYYRQIPCSGLIESYRQIYQQCDANRLNFAHFVAEGIYTGVTIENRRHSGDLDSSSIPYLMRSIARLYPHQKVYDGVCGFGRLLYLLNPPSFIARDIVPINVALTQLLFEMLARKGCFLVGDTLMGADSVNQATDQSVENASQQEAEQEVPEESAPVRETIVEPLGIDMVISQPPLGIQIDSKLLTALAKVPYLLIDDPISSRASDSLWIQEALYQTHESGRVILHIAPGWSYRAGYDLALRKELLERNWVEALIYLPGSMMSYTGIESNILILNRAKKVNTIRLIDGRSLGFISSKKRYRIFSEADIKQITTRLQASDLSEVQASDTNSNFALDIPLSEIRKKNYDLSATHYFSKIERLELTSIAEEKRKLLQLSDQCQKLQAEFQALVEEIE
ncbi:hypothetical protein DC083_06580 [Ignatzschineria ureiclastica]|uniref:site-specific DNA-methyltransferase (adenine-specific) n=1 Tax=Ignatzschineria ureiclastica TaxID=472582 RepID=A0A2U2ADP2_9GAMM|nr:N-6 DNA methylase [Ignatzschineria ureiclastica]PWD80771.1 hypothetical protein DC083_06580 [Ignatzschineria ureiclastica]GGZ94780.1 hypothetical protein GCM10007162_08360 [Ignatzschineria ureiclastica]